MYVLLDPHDPGHAMLSGVCQPTGIRVYGPAGRWVETHPTFVETTPGQTPVRALCPDSARPPHGGRFASLQAGQCPWFGGNSFDVGWVISPTGLAVRFGVVRKITHPSLLHLVLVPNSV